MDALLITPETVTEFAEVIANLVSEKIRAQAKDLLPAAMTPERFLNLGETCQELNISRPTLRKLIRAGYLSPVFKGTRTQRFRLSDIRALTRDEILRMNRQ